MKEPDWSREELLFAEDAEDQEIAEELEKLPITRISLALGLLVPGSLSTLNGIWFVWDGEHWRPRK